MFANIIVRNRGMPTQQAVAWIYYKLEFSWKFFELVLPWLSKNVSPILISCLLNHRSIFTQLDFFKNLLYLKIVCVHCLRLMLHINWARSFYIKIQPRLLAFLSYMVWLPVCVFQCIFAYVCAVVYVFMILFHLLFLLTVNCCLFGEIKMNIFNWLVFRSDSWLGRAPKKNLCR